MQSETNSSDEKKGGSRDAKLVTDVYTFPNLSIMPLKQHNGFQLLDELYYRSAMICTLDRFSRVQLVLDFAIIVHEENCKITLSTEVIKFRGRALCFCTWSRPRVPFRFWIQFPVFCGITLLLPLQMSSVNILICLLKMRRWGCRWKSADKYTMKDTVWSSHNNVIKN